VHEAVILGRPLFTDSLALTEIAAADETGRTELAVRMVMAGIADGEALFRQAKANGDDVETELAALGQERAAVEGYAHRHGLRTGAWRPDEQAEDLARRHQRIGEYMDMRVANQFVHGSTKATEQRISMRGDVTVIGDPTDGLEPWANPTGLFAVHSALCAARAICRILGRVEPRELDALMVELMRARAAAAAASDETE
jgi:hypothetical protein